MKYQWTAEEDQFLLDNYVEYGAKKCAEHFKRSAPTIRKRAAKLGLPLLEWQKLWTSEQKQLLTDTYSLLGPKRASELLNKSQSAVLRQASRLGLKAPNRPKYSNLAIQWLNSFNNPSILHAENGGEQLIKGYSVDGYDPITNTVYEFHGDRFHGNLDLFDPEDRPNPFDKRYTAEELWQRTFDRMYEISKEADIIYIWEADYNAGKESQKFEILTGYETSPLSIKE